MSEEEKEEVVYENATFKGRTLAGTGTGDNPWKRYKLIVEKNGYEYKWTCFDKISDKSKFQVSDLVEGQTYNFGRKVKELTNKEDKPYKASTVFYITNPKEEAVKQQTLTKIEFKPWVDKDQDILIGQSINLAMEFFQLTGQKVFGQEDLNKVSWQMYQRMMKAREHVKTQITVSVKQTGKVGITATKEESVQVSEEKGVQKDIPPQTAQEIEEVKSTIKEMGSATLDQLTHKFGEGTVSLVVESDEFRIDADKVTLR